MKMARRLVLVVISLFALPNTNYGLPYLRIIGGTDAPPASAPYQVIITDMEGFKCSGVIIHQHAILTAAQCFAGESPAWFKIVTGTHHLNEGGKKYPLYYYVMHPKYNKEELKNDLAIGIIKETIVLGPTVSPVSLGSLEVLGEVRVTTSGWGMTSGDAGNPLILNNVLIGVASWGVPCRKEYPDVYQRISYYLPWIYNTLQESPITRN